MWWRNSLFVLLMLQFATITISGQENNEVDDDNHTVDIIGDIIIHGEERRLSGTDRIAILRTQARHIR